MVLGLEDSGSSETNDLATSSTFYINGNQLTATDQHGKVTRTGYNERNQLASETDAFGNTSYTTYDQRGLPISVRDAIGNVTSLKFNVDGHPAEIRSLSGWNAVLRRGWIS